MVNRISKKYEKAIGLIDKQCFDEAEILLKSELESGNCSVPVYLRLGDCARNLTKFTETAQWYRLAVACDPDNFAARCNYGSVLRELHEFSQAEEQFRKAIEINNGSAAAFGNLGLLLLDLGKPNESIDCFRKALDRDPHHLLFHVYLIKSLLLSGEQEHALAAQNRLLLLFPNSVDSLIALGNIYMDIKDVANAKAFYIKVLELEPGNADAHYNLGLIMRQWNKLDEAILCFKNALKLKPSNVFAYVNIGEAFQVMGEHTEAMHYFKKALVLEPKCTMAHDNILVTMNYDPHYSSDEIAEAHYQWGNSMISGVLDTFTFKKISSSRTKIRIGYVSADFRNHPVASFLEPVLANHDRNVFEIYCYCQQKHTDWRTERFKQRADVWREITNLDDRTAVDLIRTDTVDILIDCTGHMADNRLGIFANRGAPVQITGFGYPSTTGLTTVDYHLTDAVTDPPDQLSHRGEKPLYIESGFFCYLPPLDAPAVGPLPAIKNGYITFGSLHTTARLNQQVISLWAWILKRVPDSRMILFRTTLTLAIVERLTKWFEETGVCSNRIKFLTSVNTPDYLSVYDTIDCSLDTFPWSGHTTACESLWMGVPIVTLVGDRFAGRMVASLLQRVSMHEFIANSPEDFILIAENISTNYEKLQSIRTSLRQHLLNSPVCNAAQWTREFEKKLVEICTK